MPRRTPILALLTAIWLVVPTAATATITHDNWAQNAAGPSRQAYNPTETRISSTNVGRLALAAGGFTDSCNCGMIRPIVSDGVVYTEVANSGVTAVEAWDEQSGSPLWTTDTPITLTNTFAVSDGVVVASDFNTANLYGFSTTDGSLIWTAAAGGSDVQPLIANGVVYVDHGFIQALDLHTGAIIWNGPNLNDNGQSGPTVWANGNEVFQYAGNSIYAFDTSDGHQLWATACTIQGSQHSDRSPMVLDGIVYEGSGCAINATTGTPVWNLTSNRVSLTADATGGRRIFTGYQVSKNGTVYARIAALNRNTGAVLWHHDIPSNFNPTALGEGPVTANGIVYYTDRTGTDTVIKAYDTDTGQRIWKSDPASGVYAISIADGRVWAVFANDHLVRYWALP
jgi:outer membrane protein assembly factor BamB